MIILRVSFRSRLYWRFLADTRPPLSEEFNIYLNYVRKLGFEEAPDYDFLRELFAKVMKRSGDIDDQVYDWNLLNGIPRCFVCSRRRMLNHWFVGGRGWESSVGQNNQTLQQVQNTQQTRRTDVPVPGGPVPPSPALVRHGSKRGGPTGPLLVSGNNQGVSGQLTPLSGAAQVNVSITPIRPPHQQDGHDFGEESYIGNQTYDRASPMVSTLQNAPVPLTANHPVTSQNGGIPEQEEDEPPKFSLWKILTCKCL